MIKAGTLPLAYSTTPDTFTSQRAIRKDRKKPPSTFSTMADINSDDDEGGGGKQRNKSRRELPTGAVAALKAWLLSPEHFTHPYPTPQDQVMLMQKTGIDKKQLKNWFTNARRRIWKPMLKKQLEQGKLATTGTGGGVAVPGVIHGLMVANMSGQPSDNQIQAPAQSMQEIQHGNQLYQAHPQASMSAPAQYHDHSAPASLNYPSSETIGAPSGIFTAPNAQQILSKTDSHAVLMELFARDQDLVRQATESTSQNSSGQGTHQSQMQAIGLTHQQLQQTAQPVSNQHPMKSPSRSRLSSVPTLNSWPHFSSVSSLNNLGTMPGVKSITSLSAADLAKQGPVNTVGNLAQVKSVETMGKNDSYAFLEVFFGDRSSTNLSSMGSMGLISAGAYKDQRGVKRERDEDNDVGLSLEDESPAAHVIKQEAAGSSAAAGASSSFGSNHPYVMDKTATDSSDTLKRAYDDAMAARGLMSVSRSSEKLTDLVLPAKMQRTLSQEFMRQQNHQQTLPPQQYVPYQYTPSPAKTIPDNESYQYPAQPTAQSDQRTNLGSSGMSNTVAVPSATKCSCCHLTNIDTQLRPCGHMFHEKCLKSSLQTSMGAKPKCPICQVPIESALLAIPTEENSNPLQAPTMMQPKASWNTAGNQGQAVSDAKG
jgi:type II secretory pathway pseudopilin PulG